MHIPAIFVGLALLTMGRQLYWIFVGAAGFIFASNLASQFMVGHSPLLMVIVPLAAGLAGVLLAILAQHLAVGIAGFIMGAYLLIFLFSLFGLMGPGWTLVAVAGGGSLAAALLLFFFDFALIALSSLAGATLLVGGLYWNSIFTWMLYAVLVVFGVACQTMHWKKGKEGD
ncbi:MAG: hypothetical protein JRJ12_07090 [Deltaproteobacteria bacterium]|nr:hypothetical protein [Deltaproteobacteria bacterium]MBW2071130.1 hypothetical protein [Deltaproteobacteria bacterium]